MTWDRDHLSRLLSVALLFPTFSYVTSSFGSSSLSFCFCHVMASFGRAREGIFARRRTGQRAQWSITGVAVVVGGRAPDDSCLLVWSYLSRRFLPGCRCVCCAPCITVRLLLLDISGFGAVPVSVHVMLSPLHSYMAGEQPVSDCKALIPSIIALQLLLLGTLSSTLPFYIGPEFAVHVFCITLNTCTLPDCASSWLYTCTLETPPIRSPP